MRAAAKAAEREEYATYGRFVDWDAEASALLEGVATEQARGNPGPYRVLLPGVMRREAALRYVGELAFFLPLAARTGLRLQVRYYDVARVASGGPDPEPALRHRSFFVDLTHLW